MSIAAPPAAPRPRVAFLSTIDLSLRVLLLGQMKALRDAGYDVTAISTAGPDVPVVEAAGIRHIAVPMSRRYTPVTDLRSLLDLYRVFRSEGFDVVHTNTPKASLLGQYAALLARVPHRFHTIHGLYFPANVSPRLRHAFVLLERVTMRFSEHNFAVNAEDVTTALEEHISAPERIELLGNGIDLAAFSPDRQSRQKRTAMRRALGFTDEDLVVGMVARLVVEKGYLEMFEAAARIRSHEPRARFVFVGGIEKEKGDGITPETARRWNIQDVAQFLGHRNDVADLLAIMDVHVLPSHREGFPYAPMEASSMGVPSVVTDIRGCRQAIDHGVTGFVVPVKNPEALATSILELLRDPALRVRMGQAARKKAAREFDERLVFKKVLSAYERLVPTGHPAPPRRPGGWPKRVLDVGVAASVLAATAPVMTACALAIRATMGSPVLFKQRRPGLHARPFEVMKFRTMSVPEDASGARVANDEARLTSLGRFLRKTSLDELPQLWNVLRGDMSLVGPRPLLMQYLPRYSSEQARRHDAVPGITGWAQISGRNALAWPDKLALDTWYVDHQSFLLDLKILAKTALRLVRPSGISSDGHATMSEFLGSDPSANVAAAPTVAVAPV